MFVLTEEHEARGDDGCNGEQDEHGLQPPMTPIHTRDGAQGLVAWGTAQR